MNQPHHLFAFLAFVALALGQATAQDDPQPPIRRAPDQASKLTAACKTMAELDSLSFTTSHRTTNRASPVQVRGAGAPKLKTTNREITGIWDRELLQLDLGDDRQLVFRGRRMIASDDNQGWSLRRGKLADGKDLPFALDPQVLFTTLANSELDVVHRGVGEVGGRPCETYTVRLEGDDARTLLWSGSIPGDEADASGAGNNIMIMRAIGAAGVAARENIALDLALSFDPATKRIHRVHGRSFSKTGGAGMLGGRVIINGFGPGGPAQEEEEDEKKPEETIKPGTYRDGLPHPDPKVLKTSTVVEFTYEFTDHNQAKRKPLDAAAQKLLGIQTKQPAPQVEKTDPGK